MTKSKQFVITNFRKFDEIDEPNYHAANILGQQDQKQKKVLQKRKFPQEVTPKIKVDVELTPAGKMQEYLSNTPKRIQKAHAKESTAERGNRF